MTSTEANTPPKEGIDEKRNEDVEVQPSLLPGGGGPPGMRDPSQFPDGGLTAWVCVGGGLCCAFCSFGWANGNPLEDIRLGFFFFFLKGEGGQWRHAKFCPS